MDGTSPKDRERNRRTAEEAPIQQKMELLEGLTERCSQSGSERTRFRRIRVWGHHTSHSTGPSNRRRLAPQVQEDTHWDNSEHRETKHVPDLTALLFQAATETVCRSMKRPQVQILGRT